EHGLGWPLRRMSGHRRDLQGVRSWIVERNRELAGDLIVVRVPTPTNQCMVAGAELGDLKDRGAGGSAMAGQADVANLTGTEAAASTQRIRRQAAVIHGCPLLVVRRPLVRDDRKR